MDTIKQSSLHEIEPEGFEGLVEPAEFKFNTIEPPEVTIQYLEHELEKLLQKLESVQATIDMLRGLGSGVKDSLINEREEVRKQCLAVRSRLDKLRPPKSAQTELFKE